MRGVGRRSEEENLDGEVARRAKGFFLAIRVAATVADVGQQDLKKFALDHPLVKRLPLGLRDLRRHSASVLQEEQGLRVILLDLDEELLKERHVFLQVVKDNGYVDVDHLRQRHEGGVVEESRKHEVLQVLKAVIQVYAFQRLRVLDGKDVLEIHFNLENLPMRNAFVDRKSLVVLQHAHDVIVHVMLKVSFSEALVREKENAFRDLPQAAQRLLTSKIFRGVEGCAQPRDKFRSHALGG
mmetsp:Transcript_115777/g.327458  ORF Transcript_115777/g.327458 Transcript_115777/m.327458 type:complete len:240 (+) Transcript_115777:1633-2352(+)